MRLILITGDPHRAGIADRSGVEYVMIDLEILGKEARQGHLDTVISRHTSEMIPQVKSVCRKSQVLVRVNPLNEHTREEVDEAIDRGADAVMLPMATSPRQVDQFVQIVSGRSEVFILLETVAALVRAGEIARVQGIDRVHIGLNDLHLQCGLKFMFELLSGGMLDHLSTIFIEAGIPFGFGGIARTGMGSVPSEMVLSEHVRLGSVQAILSRDFAQCFKVDDNSHDEARFAVEVGKLRSLCASISLLSFDELLSRRNAFRVKVRSLLPDIYLSPQHNDLVRSRRSS